MQLNEAARILFASEWFTTLTAVTQVRTLELSVCDLGFPRGATMPQLISAALTRGLRLAPTELGPHLRLQYLDQPEGFPGNPPSKHRAPPGSITIVSETLSEDDAFPKGFYLRRISGELWLRGYWSGADHVYAPEDRLVFADAIG